MQRLVRGEILIFRALSPSRPLALLLALAGALGGWVYARLDSRRPVSAENRAH
jgi:hypothetical protein